MGRFGQLEEIAATGLCLASDDSSFINGVALPVDGGTFALECGHERASKERDLVNE